MKLNMRDHSCKAKAMRAGTLAAINEGAIYYTKMIVPPWPSDAVVKFSAVYRPSNVILAVCTVSLTVSVPLVLLAASTNDNVVVPP